ncbi:hypothetical protein FHW36_108198 [Chitinophaga polysaccharea]|uniref:Uncharacterized protein n=1 Tax=Chitinophaga polysaccharea TaxID=1293035 RepID=A0A561PCI7_9BACT|nr:hypothetical protein FHW36_108198 [Chitinophaga polysaccharea]
MPFPIPHPGFPYTLHRWRNNDIWLDPHPLGFFPIGIINTDTGKQGIESPGNREVGYIAIGAGSGTAGGKLDKGLPFR